MIQISVKGFSFKNSEILSWSHCDSSKPGRSTGRHASVLTLLVNNWKSNQISVSGCSVIFTILLCIAVNDGYYIQQQTMQEA
jgi:hypothetical protein